MWGSFLVGRNGRVVLETFLEPPLYVACPREVVRNWEFETKDLESGVILDLLVQREPLISPTTAAALCGFSSSRVWILDVRTLPCEFPLQLSSRKKACHWYVSFLSNSEDKITSFPFFLQPLGGSAAHL